MKVFAWKKRGNKFTKKGIFGDLESLGKMKSDRIKEIFEKSGRIKEIFEKSGRIKETFENWSEIKIIEKKTKVFKFIRKLKTRKLFENWLFEN